MTPARTHVWSCSLDDLRRYAVERTFAGPDDLSGALSHWGFVQADPIQAPARAQDLTLRQRVSDYRNGDLDAAYASLPVEEDFFVNYGFVARDRHHLMHPRPTRGLWSARDRRRVRDILRYVASRGEAHPRDVDAHFAHGRVTNYWGGTSNATTHLLDAMHYRGLLRIVRRERGVRVYGAALGPIGRDTARGEATRSIDALVDLVVHVYAPLPEASLRGLVNRLRFATPQWANRLAAAFVRAQTRLAAIDLNGTRWYAPASEWPRAAATGATPRSARTDPDDPLATVRLLTPFDPLVWDRRRFEIFWGWAYRFEAYTPAANRRLGYYALPLLAGDRVVGWANVATVPTSPEPSATRSARAASATPSARETAPRLSCAFGYTAGRPPRGRAFANALDAEVARLEIFMQPRRSGVA